MVCAGRTALTAQGWAPAFLIFRCLLAITPCILIYHIREPHCATVMQVRGLFKELNVDAKFFELDEMGKHLQHAGCSQRQRLP